MRRKIKKGIRRRSGNGEEKGEEKGKEEGMKREKRRMVK